jgi:hypothetical protein
MGWITPILEADDGMVLAGHGRLAAGKLLGLTDVPVVVAHGWTGGSDVSDPDRQTGTLLSEDDGRHPGASLRRLGAGG